MTNGNMTEGNPVRLLLRFAFPLLIGNLFQQVYNLVDSIVVGKYVGADALAAIGATSSVSFLFFALSNGIGNGGGIVTSQAFGAKDEKQVKASIVNTAYIMLFAALLVGLMAYLLSSPVLMLLGTPERIEKNALTYMHMQCLGVPLVAVYNYSSSMLRALGDSKGPLWFLIVASVINVFLDILFVRGFNMSVYGAALATIIAQVIAGIGCLCYAVKTNPHFHINRGHLRINFSIIRKCIRLGVPLSVQYSLIAVSCMGLQSVVNSFGATAVAAFTATGRIEQLVNQPYITLSTALSTYTGQNYGAKKKERILEGFHKSMMIMGIFTLIMVPVMQIFGNTIIKVFVNEPDVIVMGGNALRITSIFYIFLGTIYMVRGILNGIGDAMFAFINGVVEVITRIGFPIILTGIAFIGVWGIWWAAGLVWMISAITCLMRYLVWKKKYY